jgi:hypothetical protein
LASLFGLLAHQDDCLVCPLAPSVDHRRVLAAAGLDLPQLVVSNDLKTADLGHDLVEELIPWALSPVLEQAVSSWSIRAGKPLWQPSWRQFFSKAWAADRLRVWTASHPHPKVCDAEQVGVVCRDIKKVISSLSDFPMVIKAPFSTSGRDRRRVMSLEGVGGLSSWIDGELERSGELLVEPWLERLVDLSVQFFVGADGVEFKGFSRFWTSSGGRYRGAWIGRWDQSLSVEIRRELMSEEETTSLVDTLKALAAWLGDQMAEEGFYGPVGIDAMLYRMDGVIKLKPLVEVNPRHTMGTVALRLNKAIERRSCGFWAFISKQDLKGMGMPSFVAFAEHFKSVAPLDIEKGRVRRGALFTTDPYTAASLVTVLVVGMDEQDLQELWRAGVGSRSPLSRWFDELAQGPIAPTV